MEHTRNAKKQRDFWWPRKKSKRYLGGNHTEIQKILKIEFLMKPEIMLLGILPYNINMSAHEQLYT